MNSGGRERESERERELERRGLEGRVTGEEKRYHKDEFEYITLFCF